MTLVHVAGGGEAPEGLIEAVLAYEAALVADDLDALAGFFAPGDETLRGDANGLLVGHEAITSFRGGRGGIGARTVRELRLVPAGDAWLAVSVNAPDAGGKGLVTQLWSHDGLSAGPGKGWVICAAHVTAPAKAMDSRIWRLLGAPLVRGAGEGPLAGHTVAVKDLYAIAGQRIGVGVRAYLADAPIEERTAPSVQSLLDAGADVLGIAQTDQFAYSIAGLNPDYGTPPNGAVPGAIPGGSSSGPASAVALGQASIGLGTDTAGSIRVPASYQGLWGLRTTHGAVSLEGVAPLAPRYDTVGWMTRDGETLLAAARASFSGDPHVEPSDVVLASPQVGVVVEPEVRQAFHELLEHLQVHVDLETVELPELRRLYDGFRVTQSAEAWRSDGEWITAHPGAVAPDVAERFAFAASVTPEQEAEGLLEVAALAEEINEALGGAVLVLPAAASAAPRLDAAAEDLQRVREATLSMTAIAGFTGRPALTVPLMSTLSGPVGVCLVGPRNSDLALIELGLRWQKALRNAHETSTRHTM
ncbi:AtzH-like domain-containing protein [Demequina sp. NBRC 110052]|uniref:AtzH-like domain-containing protein n=1 Tax=Demequina sp. NBRC 110052 TaxID=1570341 RepID=UPI0009FE5391|nr:AtzH-like domain-containing protein [Demequina sp. NBRC 110052]